MANEFKVRKGLVVNGSGSVILDVQGSQGQLFSVTDQLSGSLFSVNDISGVPVLEAFSDSTVKIGQYLAEAIIVSGSTARITGSLSLAGFSTGSVLFAGTGGAISQNNSNFFWDNTNGRLGIGTNAPAHALHVVNASSIRFERASTINFDILNTSGATNFLRLTANNGSVAIGTIQSIPLHFTMNGSVAATLSTNSNFIVGSTSDSGERLQVSGSSRFMGDMVITGSGNTSATTALTVQNSDRTILLRVRNDSVVVYGSANTGIFCTSDKGQTITSGAGGLYLGYFATGDLAYAGVPSVTIGRPNNRLLNATSGTQIMGSVVGNFSPTSGTGSFTAFEVVPTINQTGGANGVTRGLYVSPTLTANADFRAIEWSNNVSGSTSWGLYGAGTSFNYLNGSTGIGTTSMTYKFNVTDTTATYVAGFRGSANTYIVIGDTSLAGEQGINIRNSSGQAFIGTIGTTLGITTTSGANTITFSTAGTEAARITLGGRLLLGLTTDDTVNRLQVSGSSRFIGNMVITGSSNTSATNALTVVNSDSSVIANFRNDKYVLFGSQPSPTAIFVGGLNGLAIYQTNNSTSANVANQDGFFIGSTSSTNSAYSKLWLGFTPTTGFTNLTATSNIVKIQGAYIPPSGDGNFISLALENNISQSGGANGITRGLYVNPTLTSAWDFRSIEWSNNASAVSGSWGLYGAGTAPNLLNGRLIVNSSITSSQLLISGSGSQRLTVQGSGSSILTVDGALGRLFSVDDAASGSLFSVNTISGLPIMEAFSDNTVRIGQFGQRALFVSQSRVGIGKEDNLNATLDVSGSMALTGSFNHQGNYTTTGVITAQTLVISTISSSVVYSSGSNVFGNSLSNTQVLTGSVSITGSLTSAGNVIITGSSTFNGDTIIRGSGNTSATTALTVQNSSAVNLLTVRNDGLTTLRGTTNNDTTTIFRIEQANQNGRFLVNATGQVQIVGDPYALSDNFLSLTRNSFNPTSGNTTHNSIFISPTINQTGGANGITRGIYINPTLTSAWDYRSIEWSNNASATSGSWGLYGAGSAPNYLSGSLNIGTTATGSNILNIAGNSNFNGSITLAGNISSTSFGSFIQAGNTFSFYSSNGNINAVSNLNISLTGNATGVGLSRTSNTTLTSGGTNFLAINSTGTAFIPTTGSATMSGIVVSLIVSQSGDANGITRGLHITPTLTSAWDFRAIEWTNNASATSGSWGLYGSGSAPNYLSGSLGIGTTAPSASIDLGGVGSRLRFSQSGSTSIFTGIEFATNGSVYGSLLGNQNTGEIRLTAITSYFPTFYSSGAEAMRISTNRNLLINSTTDDTFNRLQVTGNARISQTVTASQALISGSGTQRLTVVGSGSAQPLFTVQGSQGELFSIVDSLSGSLFSVNDQSGLPIMEVFSDNTTLVGNYLAPMLLTTTKTGSAAGINTIYSLPTSSYDAVYIDYTIRSGSNARAGNFMAMWSGTSVNFTDNSITEFGSTSTFTFGAHVSGANMVVTGSAPTAGWTIKTIIKAI